MSASTEETPSIEEASMRLQYAVLSTMNPLTDNASRSQAYQILEEVRQSPSMSAPCGFLLSVHTRPQHVRHYGLHLLETAVKYHWKKLPVEEKIVFKEKTMKLLAFGTKKFLEEETYIKDKMSQVVVELAKHLWPHLWPTMLRELLVLTERGFVQTHIAMMILTRLSEDIAELQTFESQNRRRTMYAALSHNMVDLMPWLISLLELHYNSYVACEADSVESSEAANVLAVIVQSILECLTSLAVWVRYDYIFANSSKFLQTLCLLLGEKKELRDHAASALLAIVSRSQQLNIRLPLLGLFHRDYLDPMFKAAKSCFSHSASSDLDVNYFFINTMVQVVSQLGLQLCALWGCKETPDVTEPTNLKQYLLILGAFGDYSCWNICRVVSATYFVLFKHSLVTATQAFKEFVPNWLAQSTKKIITFREAWQDVLNSPFSRVQLDGNEEECCDMYLKVRLQTCKCFLRVTALHPMLVWEWLEIRTSNLLQASPTDDTDSTHNGSQAPPMDVTDSAHNGSEAPPMDVTDSVHNASQAPPTDSSNSAHNLTQDPHIDASGSSHNNTDVCRDWHAHAKMLQWSIRGMRFGRGHAVVAPNRCVDLLDLFLQYQNSNPVILTHLFSCISTLFPFLFHKPDIILSVFNKISEPLLSYSSQGESQTTHSKMRSTLLRKLSANLVNKLAKNYSELMLPGFDSILIMHRLIDDSDYPTPLSHRILLLDALLSLNNARNNYQQQADYIGSVLQPVEGLFTETKDILNSPASFMAYIGLTEEPVDSDSQEKGTAAYRRFSLLYYLKVLEMVLRRSHFPERPALQASGGFLHVVNGRSVVRNPCMEHILPLLHDIFALIRSCNSLWKPESIAALSSGYANAHKLPLLELKLINGVRRKGANTELDGNSIDDEEDIAKKTPLGKMQIFLNQLHVVWCQMLQNLCRCSDADEFYSTPNLSMYVLQAPLYGIEHLPDYRVHIMIKIFCITWIKNCPSSAYVSHLIPFVTRVIWFLYERLETRWSVVESVDVKGSSSQVEEEEEEEDEEDDEEENHQHQMLDIDSPEQAEITDALLVRILNRILFDFISCLFAKSRGYCKSDEADNFDMTFTNNSSKTAHPNKKAKQLMLSDELSPMGEFMLSSDAFVPIMTAILKSVPCPDSPSSRKACLMLRVCVKWLAVQALKTNTTQKDEGSSALGAAKVLSSLSSEDYCSIMRSVIAGIKVYERHPYLKHQLLSVAVFCYSALRRQCDELRQVLLCLPNVSAEQVQKLDKLCFMLPITVAMKNPRLEKEKKDILTTLLSSVTDSNGSEAIEQKQPAQFSALSPLFSHTQKKTNSDLHGADADSNLTNLFS